MNENKINNKENRPIEDSEYKTELFYEEINPDLSGIISDLRLSVDLLDEKFETVRSLIQELARRLDELKICKTNEIGRKIKEILKDKIKERKISERYIEKCLAVEYKREYSGKKSGISSLLDKENEKAKDKKVMIITDGSSVVEQVDNNEIADSDSIIGFDKLSDSLKTDGLLKNSNNGDCCSLIKPMYDENIEGEDGFKSHCFQTVDKIHTVKFKITKDRQKEINQEMNKCKEFIIVQCCGSGKIISITADIVSENTQPDNPLICNKEYNNNDISNDDYTY